MTEPEVIALIQELISDSRLSKNSKVEAALLNQKAIAGHQKDLQIQSNKEVFAPALNSRNAPSLTANLLGNLALAWTTQIVKSKPTAYAVPRKDTLEDQISAEITTSVVEFLEVDLQVLKQLQDCASRCIAHGTGAIKITFNDKMNKVQWKPISIFDFDIENSQDPDWVVFKEYITFWEAKEELENAGIGTDPQVITKDTPSGDQFKAVEKITVWHKPGFRFKDGKYACVISGYLVEEKAYPYVFMNEDTGKDEALLPIVFFYNKQDLDSVYGSSVISEVRDLQIAYNKMLTVDYINALQMSTRYRLIDKSLQNESIDEENQTIYWDSSLGGIKPVDFAQPASMDQNFQLVSKKILENIYDVSGINPIQTGQAEGAQTSSKAIGLIYELDKEKNTAALISFESMCLAAWTLTLKLVQKYYDAPRQARLGDGYFSFEGIDIQGVDIELESRSMDESTSKFKQADYKKEALAGLMPLDEYQRKANKTGAALGRKVANNAIDQWLGSTTVEDSVNIPDSMDPAIMMDALEERIKKAMLRKDGNEVEALMELLELYSLQAGQRVVQSPTPMPEQG